MSLPAGYLASVALHLLAQVGDFSETKKQAEEGDPVAQRELSHMYEFGKGVGKDLAESVKWLRKSAEAGDALAQRELGLLSSQGKGVPRSPSEAVKWYLKASDQGDAIAMGYLGYHYMEGLGVARRDSEALKWFKKAAPNSLSAQHSLGLMHAQGRGVPKDVVEAFAWLSQGSEAIGVLKVHVEAREALKKRLSPAQLAKAAERASQIDAEMKEAKRTQSVDSRIGAGPRDGVPASKKAAK